jgi:hypothetical protein
VLRVSNGSGGEESPVLREAAAADLARVGELGEAGARHEVTRSALPAPGEAATIFGKA